MSKTNNPKIKTVKKNHIYSNQTLEIDLDCYILTSFDGIVRRSIRKMAIMILTLRDTEIINYANAATVIFIGRIIHKETLTQENIPLTLPIT